MSLGGQIRRYAREFVAAAALVAIAAVVGGYIVEHQRLRFPWEDTYAIEAKFTSAQAVTPGQGQNVTVAGVTVGEITRVTLEEGVAVVEMDIERPELPEVYRDATMLLRPKTGLNDMSIEMDPGSPKAGTLDDGEVLPAAQTLPNVNPDEVLAGLDADTRAYLSIVANAGGRGLRGRGEDLRAVLKASQPTLERTERVTAAVADRRRQLRRLVRNLNVLSRATAEKSGELVTLVDAGNSTFEALASQEGALRDSLGRLPGTLDEAVGALEGTRTFSTRLRTALTALRPAVRTLEPALRDSRPLLREGLPILRDEIRPLVRSARPVLTDLRPALTDLSAVTPNLTRAFDTLVYVVNELAHNPPGSEEGYLFWTAWFAHNANSILSIEDGHGVAWRGALIGSCSTFAELPTNAPLLPLVIGTPVCPPTPGP